MRGPSLASKTLSFECPRHARSVVELELDVQGRLYALRGLFELAEREVLV
jgi:hypothetical protein